VTQRILIVEDEPDMRRGLRTVLEAEGFGVVEAEDGREALERVTEELPDLVVLDLMIPELDGFAVCRELRAQGHTTPVLILSARGSEVDKVLGFELGADDYVTKPFNLRELVARIRALLRRAGPSREDAEVWRFGDVVVNLRRLQIDRGGEQFELYHYEAEILRYLLRHEGQVVSRAEVLREVWGDDSFPTTRTVDFHVCNLRKKLERDSSKPAHLLTAHGVGYRLVR